MQDKTKTCCRCKITKLVSDFHKACTTKDGLRNACKQCRIPESQAYHVKNRDKIKKNHKQYYQDHKEQCQQVNKIYRQKNRARKLQKDKEYQQRPENKKRRNKRARERRRTDVLWRLQNNISHGIHKSLRRIGSSKRGQSTLDIIGWSKEDLKILKNSYLNKPCERCGKIVISSEPTNYELDHILPTSLAKTKEEIIYLNQLHNLRLICAKCNLTKRDNIEHPELLQKFEQWRQK